MSETRSHYGPCDVFACEDATATHVVAVTHPRGQMGRDRILWTCAHHAEMWRTAPSPGDYRRTISVDPLPAIEAAEVTR